ncbi:3-oxoacyl-ACP synthase [Halobacteriovorax marinus]|uniref:Beta-ketoacyl-[acyl-carrier-protein] synthase III n=1 Tax=Halobacteriovorax marinus TaxID=97084 RepID=A0A1Y5F697_9BACT|nr:3-oxoacyl-ACP synthase [Halobacteriovorax marinus]
MEYKVKIKGTGMFVPEKILTNTDLSKMVETNDEWIFDRTGIRERRISNTEGGEFPSDMAYNATLDALKDANLEPNDIDMILFGSVTPDYKLPNTAVVLQQKLGITNHCASLDIAAACSGFVYGINMAQAMIKTGMMKNILVVGSEMLSREVNWEDRGTCILFGDGCGVSIIGRNEDADESDILSVHLGADGTGSEFFDQPIGGAIHPITTDHLENRTHFMQMKGREMFKVATRTLAQNARTVLEKANLKLEDVDWLVPHQANIRIIETTGKLLGIDPEKVIINIDKYANTSAATVPMAFHEAIKDGRIKRGDIVLFDAFGAGLTTGATLLRY